LLSVSRRNRWGRHPLVVSLLILYLLLFVLLVFRVSHLSVKLALKKLDCHFLCNRMLVLGLAPNNPIVVVIALIYLTYVKAIYTQVVVGNQLVLDVILVPRDLQHFFEAVYSLIVVLGDAVTIAELVIYVHLMCQLTKIATNVFKTRENPACFVNVSECKRNACMSFLSEIEHIELLVVFS
jgi:hypothetical protein